MQRGQRRPWSTRMAFSDEKSSLGRPQMFHCRTLTGSPRAADRLNLGLQGTPAASHAVTQPARQSALCTDVKGPAIGTCHVEDLPKQAEWLSYVFTLDTTGVAGSLTGSSRSVARLDLGMQATPAATHPHRHFYAWGNVALLS